MPPFMREKSMENVVPGNLQRLRAADIIRMAGLSVASVGQEYYRSGVVHSMSRRGAALIGIVELPSVGRSGAVGIGGEQAQENGDTPSKMVPQRFSVEVELLSPISWLSKCSCHSETQEPGRVGAGQGLCVHCAALLYQWLAQPSLFQTLDEHPETPIEATAVKPMHENEASDVTSGERKGMADAGERASPAPTVSTFPAAEQIETPVQRYSVELAPTESLLTLLSHLSLSELRAMAREYDLAINGTSKPQLAESIQTQLKKPDVVRRVATTLEKAPRQLLAALILAGGVMSDDDLRGLFERFSLGQPSQLQYMLLILQSKALLFRISLNASNIAQRSHHGLLNSALLDIGWYVPWDVCNALRVSVPVTLYDVTKVDEQGSSETSPRAMVEFAEPSGPLSMLLLLARLLDGYIPRAHETWFERHGQKRSDAGWGKPNVSMTNASSLPSSDGSVVLPPPEDLPSSSLLQELQAHILSREGADPVSQKLQPAFLRFIIRVLGVADILHKEEGRSSALRLRSDSIERLLGAGWPKTLRTLFKHWLIQTSYGDLYDLTEEHVRLRCRATSQHQPILRASELEAEHSQARQSIIGLLAQAPLNQWINFSAFARFVYRLNPLFLQRRYQSSRAMIHSAVPQWWLELDEGRSLRPLQLSDWLRAELLYLRRLIAGPLHWWGVCDILTGTSSTSTSSDGQLLAFRLTPMAGWLFNGIPVQGQAQPLQLSENLQEKADYREAVAALEVVDASSESGHVGPGQEQAPLLDASALPLLLVSCSVQNCPVIQLLEIFTEAAGVLHLPLSSNLAMAYRVSARAFGHALGRGLRPFVLLRLLRLAAEVKADSDVTQSQLFSLIATQLEQWLVSYGRVRLYTGVTLLETVDAAVMREVVATTSLEEALVQSINPTLCIVKPRMLGHIVDELKQRGQSPLLHDEDL